MGVLHWTAPLWISRISVDDHLRLAYTEILSDERKDTAAGFWERANAFFAGSGITAAGAYR